MMHLQLPPEVETALIKQAAAAGVDAEQLAVIALEQGLTAAQQHHTDVMLPRRQWKAAFEALKESFLRRTSQSRVDCSRDSMYGDRGR